MSSSTKDGSSQAAAALAVETAPSLKPSAAEKGGSSDQTSLTSKASSRSRKKGILKGPRSFGKAISQNMRKGLLASLALEGYDEYKSEILQDMETAKQNRKLKRKTPRRIRSGVQLTPAVTDFNGPSGIPLEAGPLERGFTVRYFPNVTTIEAAAAAMEPDIPAPNDQIDGANGPRKRTVSDQLSKNVSFLMESAASSDIELHVCHAQIGGLESLARYSEPLGDESRNRLDLDQLSGNFNEGGEDDERESVIVENGKGDSPTEGEGNGGKELVDVDEEEARGAEEAEEEAGRERKEGGAEEGVVTEANGAEPMEEEELDDDDDDPKPMAAKLSQGSHRLGWHPPDKDPLLHFLSKKPMKHLKDFVEAKGVKMAAWFLNVEAKAMFTDMGRAEAGTLPAIDTDTIRFNYWLTLPQFLNAVGSCPCNDHQILEKLGIHWTQCLVESITREAAALVEKKYDQFWNLNTPRGCFNYLGLFFMGESASFNDLPTEMTEEERRAELRKPEKDRVQVTQEQLDMVQYKKWWNRQVAKARDRIEQLRYEDWLRHKPDSDLEFDWDLDESFHPYQPPGGDDENLNLYLETCIKLKIPACSPFVRQIHSKDCRNRYYGLGPEGAKAVAVAMCYNEDIVHLDLTDNGMGAMGAKYIAQAMKLNESVEDLNLSENGIQSFGLKMICASLLSNSTITKLDLSGNGLRCCDAPYLAAVLRINPQLVDLNLSHNQFADKGGVYLGNALQRNKTLRKIDLSWNHLKDPGSLILLGGIRRNFRGLESVNLASNGLSTPDVLVICMLLKRHRTLIELDISQNPLTPENGVLIAAAMENNRRLEVLRVGKTTIGCASALAILQAVLNPLSKVKIMDMENVDVQQEFVDTLEDSPRSQELKVIYGHVMATFTPTNVYQHKRDFAREILAVFNSEHFKPVRIYFFKSKTDFIDFLLRFDKIGTNEVYVPDMKMALDNPINFEFESEQLLKCQADLEALARRSTDLGFSSIRDTTFNFSGFYVV